MKTNLKCTGCKCDFPKMNYDPKTGRGTWFGVVTDDAIVEWVCVECWDKGTRCKK